MLHLLNPLLYLVASWLLSTFDLTFVVIASAEVVPFLNPNVIVRLIACPRPRGLCLAVRLAGPVRLWS